MWSTVVEVWSTACDGGMSLEEWRRAWALPAFSSVALFKTLVAPLSRCLKLFYKILAQRPSDISKDCFQPLLYSFTFRLVWVFVPVEAFSRCTVRRLRLRWCVASRGGGFSWVPGLQELQLLGSGARASGVVVHGLFIAPQHVGSSQTRG